MATFEAFLEELLQTIPRERVSTDANDRAAYGRDWTRVFEPNPFAVVFPESTAEVSEVLSLANAHGVAVVPSGGRTGLAGGAVAREGELVLSLERMRRLGPVDELGGTVRVQAGAVTEAVHEHAAAQGFTWPVDFASKGSSHVGGNIATNAGGVRVIRYGTTRPWVLGLQVVLASGEVLEVGGALEKDNTGVDLRQLFIGSEGTLGVITEAVLKLTPLPGKPDVFLFSVDGLSGVLALFQAARRAPFTINAFEFFTSRCLDRVKRHRSVNDPLTGATHYVLLEVDGAAEDDRDRWLLETMEAGLVSDGAVAQSREQARALWDLREGISESLSATGLPHKNDVALPIAELESFCGELETVFEREYPGWEICLFGHIGDGNLHINVMKPESMDKKEFLSKTKGADEHIFRLVQRHRGSISAEHGIGLLKKDGLGYTRSPSEIALMRQLKSVLDPKGILNPGKVFELASNAASKPGSDDG